MDAANYTYGTVLDKSGVSRAFTQRFVRRNTSYKYCHICPPLDYALCAQKDYGPNRPCSRLSDPGNVTRLGRRSVFSLGRYIFLEIIYPTQSGNKVAAEILIWIPGDR